MNLRTKLRDILIEISESFVQLIERFASQFVLLEEENHIEIQL